MRKSFPLLLLAGLLLATPLMADHRHRRGCGHHFEPNRGWISVEAYGPRGGFAFHRAPGVAYYRDGYYDGRRAHRYCERRCRHRHRHVHYRPEFRHFDRCPHPRHRGRW